MDLLNHKCFVTGADGFIGSHLTEALVRRGCKVRAFVHYNSFSSLGWLDHSPPEILEQIEVVAGDIRDPSGVRQAMTSSSVVFHLAAIISVPFSYHCPDIYVDTNVVGTLNVLQAARELTVQKFVHTSSSEVYGTPRAVPITEEHPVRAQSPYAASKIAADQLALSFYCSFGTPIAIIRPFNTYGPRQSVRAIIPSIIIQIARRQERIFLGAVHPTRDFNFVDDVVRAFIAIAETDGTVGEVVNVGTSHEISIGATARLIAELMGARVDVETELARVRPPDSEVLRLCADSSKAQRVARWTPLYGGPEGFRRGLEETISWFVNPTNLAFYKTISYKV